MNMMREKIGRNDPCPCGSGKKFKKCCGASNVIALNPDRYNDELNRLHENLLGLAFGQYEDQMLHIAQQYPQPQLEDDENLMETFLVGISAWTIMHEPVTGNQKTIYDLFHLRQERKIKHSRVRETFASWRGVSPAVYEVLSVSDGKALIQDVRSQDTFQIMDHEDDYVEGDLHLGILLPFVGYHEFLVGSINVQLFMEEVLDLLEDYRDEDFHELYPDFLGEVLSIDTETMELEWGNRNQELAAEILAEHMREKKAERGMIATGVMMWHDYCENNNPMIKKPNAYAAAVEYLVHNALSEDSFTQKELAEEYNVTAGSISTNVRKLEDHLHLGLEQTFFDYLAEDNEEEELHTDLFDEEGDLFTNPFLEAEADEVEGSERRDGLNPFGTEKTMRDLQKFLAEQDFDSTEDIQQLIDDFNNNQMLPSVSDSPRDLAQDKLYEAFEEKGKKRKKLIKEALDLYPHLPDAYTLMAEDAKSIDEKKQLYQQALRAGEQDLGKEFFLENKGHFWLMTETRPYMRAKEAYAAFCDTRGDHKSALAQYEELLELNPSDNQGIRYLLLPLYLEEEEYQEAEELLDQYEGDIAANFLFNHALLHYMKKGVTPKTKSLLKKATEHNPYVKDYLTGDKAIPNQEQSYIGLGDESEAAAYAQDHIHLWHGEEELLKILSRT